ncbi:putative pectate lyase C [Lachnellula suecica]|uniref:Putative pectate lyase C n=1 Tax=Lachnellula suecica TaxID=602035 RepID=A0A8T9CGV2_9HELO|nr:putative pectate lyase C [Lachnellula suecica]
MKLFLVLLSFALAECASCLAAFPGAEGFGAEAAGARTGTVYVVTNKNDTGAGSLRDALSAKGRTVVFAVGGREISVPKKPVIQIKDRIVVPAHTTILGQTAPGGGITVYGNGWSFSNSNNTIIRYLRIRMGKSGSSGKDAIGIADGNTMIFDHLSVSWGRDETFSINGSGANITIQNSIIGQGLETHSCGGLIQTSGGVSLFRNLYIDNQTRNPKVKGGGGGGYIAGGDSEGQSYVNIMGNYFISGPNTSITAFSRSNANFHGYVSGNYYDSDKNGILDGSAIAATSSNYGEMVIMDTQYTYPAPTKLLTPPQAVDLAIKSVGASLVRDSIDTRLISELQSYGTTGELITDETASPMSGPGTIDPGTVALDTDGDGIPDSVEVKMGTDPNVADSMNIGASGYTNIEMWANSLVPSSY